MGAPKRKRKTRKDYRTAKLGTIQHYLLAVYPRQLDYSWADLLVWHRMHSSLYRATPWDKLAMAAMERQEPIPWARFQEAIREIKTLEHATPSGTTLVTVLEWYQGATWNKVRGRTIQKLALELGADVSTVSRWRDRCIDLITQMVFREQEALLD